MKRTAYQSLTSALTSALGLMLLVATLPAAAWADDTRKAANKVLTHEDVSVARYELAQTTDNNLYINLEILLGKDFKMSSNRMTHIVPLFHSADTARTHDFDPVVVYGRRREIIHQRNGLVPSDAYRIVRREQGEEQRIEYSASIPYEQWMDDGRLELWVDLCGCADCRKEELYIPVGQLLTPVEPAFIPAFVRPPHIDVKRDTLEREAFVEFVVDRTELKKNHSGNEAELRKIVSSIDTIRADKNLTITYINIHGYASPESPYRHNKELAEGRAATLLKFVRGQYAFPDSVFSSGATPEYWSGLRERVAASDLEHRDEILAVIDGPLAPDPKEQKIKSNWPKEYRFMLDYWYPSLRRSVYKVGYIIRGFNAEEAREVFRTKPAQLSLEEMFMVAELYPVGSEEFRHVFDVAVRLHPSDPIANLNAACIALDERNIGQARRYLAKAGESPEATHARAVLAVFDGNYNEARRLFLLAQQAGVEQATPNLQLLDKIEQRGMKK